MSARAAGGARRAIAQAAGDAEAQAIAERLKRLGRRIDIVLPEDNAELMERIVEEFDRATVAAVRAGFLCLALKSRLPHGEFAAAIEARHIPQQRASEFMRIANWLANLETRHSNNRSSGYLSRVFNLGPKKLLELSRVDPQLFDNQTEFDLTDIDCMSLKMLRKEVKKLRNKSVENAKKADHWKNQTQVLIAATGAERAGSERPASVARARSEAAALADQGIATIGALAHQADALLRATDLGDDRAARVAHLEAAAGPLALHLAAVASAALHALAQVKNDLGDYMPAEWTAETQPAPLTEAEAHRLAQWRAAHVRKMAAEAIDRENARVARGEIKRARGRPVKNPLGEMLAQLAPPKRPPGRPRKETTA